MAGRKPKPTALRVIEGNPGKRRINRDEPKPAATAPEPPDWLDPVAREKWYDVVPELDRLKVITCIDGATLAAYCVNYSRWVKAEGVLQEKGTTYITHGKHGDMERVRPEVKIADEAMKQMRAFATEFGLTPSSRTRLKGTPGQGDLFGDGFDEFMNGKR